MNKFCFMLLICLITLGCKNGLRDKIEAKIQEKCRGIESCKIDLKEVTDFKWDRLYIFEPNVVIDMVPGFPSHYIGDDSRHFFFVKNDAVVHHEEEDPLNPSGDLPKGGVSFDIYNNRALYYCFDATDAIFEVKKTVHNGIVYYDLTPLKTKN